MSFRNARMGPGSFLAGTAMGLIAATAATQVRIRCFHHAPPSDLSPSYEFSSFHGAVAPGTEIWWYWLRPQLTTVQGRTKEEPAAKQKQFKYDMDFVEGQAASLKAKNSALVRGVRGNEDRGGVEGSGGSQANRPFFSKGEQQENWSVGVNLKRTEGGGKGAEAISHNLSILFSNLLTNK